MLQMLEEKPAEPAARANAYTRHGSCLRTCRAALRRGSSVTFGSETMNHMTKQSWSRSMRAIWLFSSVLFGAVGLAMLVYAAVTLKKEGRVDYRALSIAAGSIGVVFWSLGVRNHPEEWLDSEGKAKMSFHFKK